MLQLNGSAITETGHSIDMTGASLQTTLTTTDGMYQTSNCYQPWPYQTVWQNYLVYVYSDKTAKAIEVLKALQAEKILKCDSVPRFIMLVEKIAGLL